jgi:hypothetical protein
VILVETVLKSRRILDYVLEILNLKGKLSKEDFEMLRQGIEWYLKDKKGSKKNKELIGFCVSTKTNQYSDGSEEKWGG